MVKYVRVARKSEIGNELNKTEVSWHTKREKKKATTQENYSRNIKNRNKRQTRKDGKKGSGKKFA